MFEVSQSLTSCLFFVCSRRVPWWGYDLYLPQAWPRVKWQDGGIWQKCYMSKIVVYLVKRLSILNRTTRSDEALVLSAQKVKIISLFFPARLVE